MGTCGQPGYVFRDFCLKQGIEFIIFCLNQGIDLSIFVLNRMSFLLAYGNCARSKSGGQKLGVLPKRHDNSLSLRN